MSQSLYDITGQYRELAALATDPNSELTHEAIADTLQGIQGSFEEKAEKVAVIINGVGANVTTIDNEIKRLQERKRIIQNRDKSIREYLLNNMTALEIKKIECSLFSITLAKGRDSVVVDDVNRLPDEFISVKSEVVADKKALLTALKNKDIEGARIETGKPSIRIK